MRVIGRLTAAAVIATGLCCATGTARADFVVSHTIETGSGSLAGFDVVRFYARNTQSGLHPTSTQLAGYDVSFSTTGGNPVMEFKDINNDGYVDANLGGIGQTPASPTASFVKIGNDGDAISDAIGYPVRIMGSATNNPVAYYTGRSEFRVAMVNYSNKRPTATTGVGALFAVIVVPSTVTNISLIGQLADEQGAVSLPGPAAAFPDDAAAAAAAGLPPDSMPADGQGWQQSDFTLSNGYFLTYSAAVPEPATLGLTATIAIGTLARRRRAAK